VLVSDLNAATALGVLNHSAAVLGQQFLPGGLTLVVPLKEGASLCTHSEQTTVGIRMIDHPFCQALATMTAFPITATSANRSGEPTPPTVTAILAQFGERASMIDLVIDGGTLSGGIPSTVVDTTSTPPALRRAGAIPWESILLVVEKASNS
jgi:L-threonylcarbamoyladenylate synthase